MDQKPSSLLLEFAPILPKGRVLDVAIGKGRNGLYLAKNGFDVEGIDSDQAAINACMESASVKGVRIKTRLADLKNYHIPLDSYEVILCFNFLQRDLIPQMKAGLKKGGILLYETFLIDQHIRFGKPKHKEYCFKRNELLHFFHDFRILYYREGFITRDKAVASLAAQKKE